MKNLRKIGKPMKKTNSPKKAVNVENFKLRKLRKTMRTV
jgi:hypothetical protein